MWADLVGLSGLKKKKRTWKQEEAVLGMDLGRKGGGTGSGYEQGSCCIIHKIVKV